MATFDEIYEKIKEYPTIILHRHTSPDPDAIGSQAGLARSLRLAFPDKKILCAGENDEGDLIWINKMDEVTPEDYQGALVITTDTANTPRISNKNYDKGDFLIKIDHHPDVDPYADMSYVDPDAPAASEIVDIAREIADVTFDEAKLQALAMDKMEINPVGAAYTILMQDDLKKMGLTDDQANVAVSTPGRIKDVLAWNVFVEKPDGTFRVHYRSKGPVINHLAEKHDGGGHALASGANAKDMDEVKQVFDEVIDENAPVTQAVVTAPSRELANQLYKVARQLRDASGLNISIEYLGGGNDRNRQIEKAENRAPQLIIATPGRLHDFASKKVINLDNVKAFIIDEADMTLDMGFLSQMDEIISKLDKKVVLGAFSATIPVKLENFLRKYMSKPDFIVIDNPAIIAPTIQNDLIDVGSRDKKEILYKLLTMGQPYLALVFANTKKTVDELTNYLEEQGLKVAKIHGGITERERKRIIRQVREGQYQYVVASDLAARGIDVPGVSLVVNYEIPKDLEFVIHRIGRTGRNGLEGHAITLIYDEEMPQIEDLEKLGIHFDFKEIKNGELVERTHYHRRDNRQARSHKLDNRMIGMVKKTKKKVKPGYKKKIKQAIQKDRQQKRKIEERHQIRKAKRRRKREREQARGNFDN